MIAWALGGWIAWFVGAFAASAAYLMLSAVELAVARALRPILPVDEMADPGEEAEEDAEPA